ncbi:MAG: DUF1343 domain-containing protein [Planctomycetota bacterium]
MTRFTFLMLIFVSLVATAMADDPASPPDLVRTGIDVLRSERFTRLKDANVGLITNHTGVAADGTSTVTLFRDAPGLQLKALFSPEHGFAGKLDQAEIGDATDEATGLKIFSLYGKTRVPTAESLQGIDTLVFDIQDIGTRFYTYISTMGGAMRVAAESGIRFVVLDRPNPIGGAVVQGPVLDAGSESFVGYHTIPLRHGMTTGELATMFRDEFDLDLNLDVVRCQGWQRSDWYDTTGLLWINPSPNMRCLNQATLYPGVGLIETTNVSVGRGTDTPFEVVGAPWIGAREFAAAMNHVGLVGVRFVPVEFVPDSSKHSGEVCGGIQITITNREKLDPVRLGLELAIQLRKLYPNDWDVKLLNRLLGSERVCDAILGGESVAVIESLNRDDLERFGQRRAKYLLYD